MEGWRILTGSAHRFDEGVGRAGAEAEYDRMRDPLTAMNHALRAGGEGWYGRHGEINVPTLVIHGAEDNVLPYAHGQALARELPNAELLTLEGTGHELHRDDWDVMLDAVVAHIACQRGGRGE